MLGEEARALTSYQLSAWEEDLVLNLLAGGIQHNGEDLLAPSQFR